MIYDIAIIGGGPAGCAAGVYAARKRLKTLFLTESFEGQSNVSDSIENWIGNISISGKDLSKNLENHLRAYSKDDKGEEIVSIITGVKGNKVEKKDKLFEITDSKGNVYSAKAVLITTGGKRKRMNVLGADKLEHKGLTYCASCDGPLFSGKDVAVIGGGNAGFETAAQLSAYAKSVTLLHYRTEFKADPVTVSEISKIPNIKAIAGAETIEVYGDKFVQGLKYKNVNTGEIIDLPVSGIFVEIGNIPNTDLVANLVKLSPSGAIEIDPWTNRASIEGIWAAGDCTNTKYHQNNIATGDGVNAIEDAYLWIKTFRP